MMKIDLRRVVVKTTKNFGEYIRFSSNGQIAISSSAVKSMKIEEDDKAVFFQDNNNPKDWYFSLGKEGDYELKKNKSKPEDMTMSFNSTSLKDEILTSLDLSLKTHRLYIAKEPVVLEDKNLWKLNYRK